MSDDDWDADGGDDEWDAGDSGVGGGGPVGGMTGMQNQFDDEEDNWDEDEEEEEEDLTPDQQKEKAEKEAVQKEKEDERKRLKALSEKLKNETAAERKARIKKEEEDEQAAQVDDMFGISQAAEEESKDPLVKAMKRLELEDDTRTAFVEALVGKLGDNKTLMSFVIDLIKEGSSTIGEEGCDELEGIIKAKVEPKKAAPAPQAPKVGKKGKKKKNYESFGKGDSEGFGDVGLVAGAQYDGEINNSNEQDLDDFM